MLSIEKESQLGKGWEIVKNYTYPLFNVIIRAINIIVYRFVVAQDIVTKARGWAISVIQYNREQVCT